MAAFGARAARAEVAVAVAANGVVDVAGDSGPNSIEFANGSSTANAYYGSPYTALVKSLDGQPITIGSGCVEYDGGADAVVCGTGTAAPAIAIQMGDANDTVDYDVPDSIGPWFTSVTINGGAGDDRITLSGLESSPNGGTTVAVDGGPGDDTIDLTDAHDLNATLDGDDGNDTITGGGGSGAVNTIDGGNGDDTLLGGSGAGRDVITGDAGSDTITGQGGQSDTLDGGSGRDALSATETSAGNLSHGTVTIDAVDGEQDTVTCDPLGTTIANIDQYDVTNKTYCAEVNVTDVGACPTGEVGTPPNCTTSQTTGSGPGGGGSGPGGGGSGPGGGGPGGGTGHPSGPGAGTRPNTRITRRTIMHRTRSATFRFRATGRAISFECALLRQPKRGRRSEPRFSRCHSPKSYEHLGHGRYVFYVRAVGSGGSDPTPAMARFKL